MIRRAHPGTQRRVAILVLVLVVGLGTAAAVLPFWWLHASYDAQIARLQARLTIATREAAAASRMSGEIMALRRSESRSNRYLPGDNAGIAMAELQGLVGTVARRNEVEVQSTQPMPATDAGHLAAVTIRVHARGSLEALMKSLLAFEVDPHHLRLERVGIQNRMSNRSLEPPRYLDIEFDIAGFMRRSE